GYDLRGVGSRDLLVIEIDKIPAAIAGLIHPPSTNNAFRRDHTRILAPTIIENQPLPRAHAKPLRATRRIPSVREERYHLEECIRDGPVLTHAPRVANEHQ